MTIIASPAVPVLPPMLPPVAATPLPAGLAIGFAGLLAAALPDLIAAETGSAAPATAGAPQPDGVAADPGPIEAVCLPKGFTPSPAEIVPETTSAGSTPDGNAGRGRVPDAGKPILPVSGSPARRRVMPRALAALDRQSSPVAVTRLPPEITNPLILKVLPQAPDPKVAAGDSAKVVARPAIVDAARPQSSMKETTLMVPSAGPHSASPEASLPADLAAPKSRDETIEPPVSSDTPAVALPPVTANVVPKIMAAGAPPRFDRPARPVDLGVAGIDRTMAASASLAPPAPGPERSPGPPAAPVGAPVLQPVAVPDGPVVALPAAGSAPAAPAEALPMPPSMPVGAAPMLAVEADDRTDGGGLVAALPLLVSAPTGAHLPPVRAVPPSRVAGDAAVDQGAVAERGAVAAPLVMRKADASSVASAPAASVSPPPGRIEERQQGRDRPMIGLRVDRSVAPPIEAAQRPPLPLPLAEIPLGTLAPLVIAQTGALLANAGPGTPALRDPPAALALSVASDQLGAVSIGVEDLAGDLRVRLSGSTAAAGAMTAEAPRLIAELAANGMRLGSLDITGRADAPVAATAPGDGRSGQRAPSGAADSGMTAAGAGGSSAGGGGPSDGQPSNSSRAPPPLASIAAFARDGIARDLISRPRPTPSDRYA